MPFADDHPPLPSADLDQLPFAEPLKARRDRWDAAAITPAVLCEELACRRIEPGPAGEIATQHGGIVPIRRHSPPGATGSVSPAAGGATTGNRNGGVKLPSIMFSSLRLAN